MNWYKTATKKFDVTCSYCGKIIKKDVTLTGPSHGICPSCYEKELIKMDQEDNAKKINQLDKKAMALDPNAWQYEQNPARLTKDLPFVTTPFGKVLQLQNQDQLQKNYYGVHFTGSKEIAAIYACGKATANDPPVLIELDPIDFQKEIDVDAVEDKLLQYYITEKQNVWKSILSSKKNNEDKMIEIYEDLNKDKDRWDAQQDEYSDAADIIAEQQRVIAPSLIESYLSQFNTLVAIKEIKSILNGKIPKQLLINSVNQYRVMQPVGNQRVRAIYKIPWINFGVDPSEVSRLKDMDEQELEEEGYRKDGDDIIDNTGKILLDYDSISYDWWLSLETIYKNKQMSITGFESDESTWHGTTLSRVKQAYPEFFGGTINSTISKLNWFYIYKNNRQKND